MNNKVKVLKEALRRLERGGNQPCHGICYHLHDAGQKLHMPSVANSLAELISRRLGSSYNYLHTWLYYNGHMTAHEYHLLVTTGVSRARAKLKATRIAWLESLIKEHETCKPTKKSSRPSA